MSIKHQIGNKLKRAREAARLSQGEVARLTNCSQQVISAYEKGRLSIRVPFFCRLAKLYRVDAADLLPEDCDE